jgi:hypothetical protein
MHAAINMHDPPVGFISVKLKLAGLKHVAIMPE